jgi:hypothetical protein
MKTFWKTIPEIHAARMYEQAKKRVSYPGGRRDKYNKFTLDFSLEEFYAYLRPQWKKYAKLHSTWVESGHQRGLCPTIDRKDSDRGYALDNIQIITLEDNLKRIRRKRYLYKGKMLNLRQIAIQSGIPYKRLYPRVRIYGQSIEKAIQHIDLRSKKKEKRLVLLNKINGS